MKSHSLRKAAEELGVHYATLARWICDLYLDDRRPAIGLKARHNKSKRKGEVKIEDYSWLDKGPKLVIGEMLRMKEILMKKKQRRDKRDEFYCDVVTILDCRSGNFEHGKGKPAMSITLGLYDGTVEKIAFSLDDARKLILDLLLWTAVMDDSFAHQILDEMFPAGKDGNFKWPDQPHSL